MISFMTKQFWFFFNSLEVNTLLNEITLSLPTSDRVEWKSFAPPPTLPSIIFTTKLSSLLI